MTQPPTTPIKVPVLARVEGEGGLEIVTEHGQVTEARLDIYEPPRFFEGLLRGRRYTEPPDITARICGICPVAYQMSACLAIEDACGVTVPEPVTALRRLLYCGEWIESHVLHIYLLHAPDFLGYESGIHLARDHPEILQRGLRMKKAGNRLMEVVGGRSVHPVNVRVGGFYRAPDPRDLRALRRRARVGPAGGAGHGRLGGGVRLPRLQPRLRVRLAARPGRVPDHGRPGRLKPRPGHPGRATTTSTSPSTRCRTPRRCTRCSTATAPTWSGRWPGTACTPGGCPRRRRPPRAPPGSAPPAPTRSAASSSAPSSWSTPARRRCGSSAATSRPTRRTSTCRPPRRPGTAAPKRRAGCSTTATRSPPTATIADAKIVPPTSQNQRVIEADLREFAGPRLDLPHEQLTWQCEQAVRNHDPCISCSTHFLDLRVRSQSS